MFRTSNDSRGKGSRDASLVEQLSDRAIEIAGLPGSFNRFGPALERARIERVAETTTFLDDDDFKASAHKALFLTQVPYRAFSNLATNFRQEMLKNIQSGSQHAGSGIRIANSFDLSFVAGELLIAALADYDDGAEKTLDVIRLLEEALFVLAIYDEARSSAPGWFDANAIFEDLGDFGEDLCFIVGERGRDILRVARPLGSLMFQAFVDHMFVAAIPVVNQINAPIVAQFKSEMARFNAARSTIRTASLESPSTIGALSDIGISSYDLQSFFRSQQEMSSIAIRNLR
ncbi:MAG: hypothetical protein AAF219_08315 [Myxococcota bacterium]